MRATAEAHPNIALIKYWGKQDAALNLPAVGSLSVTLGGLTTTTTVEFKQALPADRLIINGTDDAVGTARVSACLDRLRGIAGVGDKAIVTTQNDFPTGAGLASSASGFAALITAAEEALGLELSDPERVEHARRGSGSAPRSLFGGFVLLEIDENGGTPCRTILDAEAWPLTVLIAVTSDEAKAIGSTDGMEASRSTSPYFARWVDTHGTDLETGVQCVTDRNFDRLAVVAEHNCLKMHAVAMTSNPPLLYWSGATLECAQVVRELRAGGVPAFFSIDAGPQLKAFCPPDRADEVRAALETVPGVLRIISSSLGEGARVIR